MAGGMASGMAGGMSLDTSHIELVQAPHPQAQQHVSVSLADDPRVRKQSQAMHTGEYQSRPIQAVDPNKAPMIEL